MNLILKFLRNKFTRILLIILSLIVPLCLVVSALSLFTGIKLISLGYFLLFLWVSFYATVLLLFAFKKWTHRLFAILPFVIIISIYIIFMGLFLGTEAIKLVFISMLFPFWMYYMH